MTASINDLPNEILEFVFNLLPPYQDLELCAAVCKRWNLLAKNVKARKKFTLQKGLIDFNLCWKEILNESTPQIAARFAHASSLHRHSMYVFGGASSYDTTFNDLWKFDLSRREWVRPISMGTYPSPKAGASLVCHNDLLILYGGWRHAYTPFHMCTLIDELHMYNIGENRWTIVNPTFGPPPMTGHSATVHHNKMILFGGYQKNMESLSTSNDIWVLDLDDLTWKEPAVSVLKPPPRYGQFQMAIGEDHILVLGGTGGVNRVFNDAWLLDMQNDTWVWKRVNIKNKKGTVTHNWCYPACNVGSKVIVLGPTSPNDFQIIRPSRPAGLQPPAGQNRNRAAMGPAVPPPPPRMEPNIPRNSQNKSPSLPPPPPAAASASTPAPALPGPSSSNNNENVTKYSAPSNAPTDSVKPGPSGLRPTSSPNSGGVSARPLPTIRSAFARQSSEDDHLPKRFNQQPPEQHHMSMAAFSVPPTNPPPSVSSRVRPDRVRLLEEKLSAIRRRKEAEQQQPQQQQQQQPNAVPSPSDERQKETGTQESNHGQNENKTHGVSNTTEREPVTPKRVKRNGLAIYVCDVSNLLPTGGEEPSIEWHEPKNSGLIEGAPDHYTFSTMVSGNGELIVFGGLNKNNKSENLCVSNSVHLLTVPTTVV